MVLVADSGSTKTDWSFFSNERSATLVTNGISPYFQTVDEIQRLIADELLLFLPSDDPVSFIYFYGTGCNVPTNVQLVSTALRTCFPASEIFVADDLIGSARALCGDQEGIVCILGTGSNSGYFNGREILKSRPGIGYILGDEGSGAYLGKKLAQAYLNDLFDSTIKPDFERECNVSAEILLRNVYGGPWPNRYLAELSRFLYRHRGNDFIETIIKDALRDFIHLHVLAYAELKTVHVHFTGGVAFCYSDVISALCVENNINIGNIVSSPIETLTQFHKKRAGQHRG